MKREEMARRLYQETANVRVSPELARRVARAAQGKEKRIMKRKISVAAAFALVAVLLCTVALAAASRLGILDYVKHYAGERYIPEDAQSYVASDVLTMDDELAAVAVREMYYDGRIMRMTVDVTPKDPGTLLVGTDMMLSDNWQNLVRYDREWDETDTRSVYAYYKEKGYREIVSVNVWGRAAQDDWAGAPMAMDYNMGEDGVLTFYVQTEYAQDLPEREVCIGVGLSPYAQPVTEDGTFDDARKARLERSLTLTAAAKETDAPQAAGAYVNVAPVAFPEAGVQVDRVLLEVKPMEIYATVEYSVVDREAYAKTDDGLWFEFIDPGKPGEAWEQRLTAGLTGGGSSGPVDGDPQTATHFRQTDTLGLNELHETYTLRAFECWNKQRFDTREIEMRPATAEDLAQ